MLFLLVIADIHHNIMLVWKFHFYCEDEEIRQCRIGGLYDMWRDDKAQDLKAAHPQCLSGVKLCLTDRLDAAALNFGKITGRNGDEGDQRGRDGRQKDAPVGKSVEQKEQHHE